MMIKVLRDLLRSYLKEHASNQVKHHKSKLLIYDEYLKKYVSADELLIPGVKVKNKGSVTLTKSKELFIFDILFQKFVNPKLDLLVPGVKNLDLLIDTSNKLDNVRHSSRNYFWGKKTTKKHAVCPLPPVHAKTVAETEPSQLGWAGQKTSKPETNPRPELSKPECNLGPGKDPKKKKPPKKKSKKNKYLICGKKKDKNLKKSSDKNLENNYNKTDAKETTKDSSKGSKEIVYNEDNCYSDLKENGKQPKSQDSINDVSKTTGKSNVNKDMLLENLIKDSGKPQNDKGSMFKAICSKLFSNKVNMKESTEPTTRESISGPSSKMKVFDEKANTSQNRKIKENKDSMKECSGNKSVKKGDGNLKNNQSKALVCKEQGPSSLMPDSKTTKSKTTDSKVTSLYLCKDQKSNSKEQSKQSKTENMQRKNVCVSNTANTNERNCDKMEISNYKQEKKENTSCICAKKSNNDDCKKSNSIKYTSIDKIKFECKKPITIRPNTSPAETPDISKAQEHTTLNNAESDGSKCRKSPYNFIVRPKNAYFVKPFSKTSSLTTSEQSTGDCILNAMRINEKSDQKNTEPCKFASAEQSKVKEKSNEANHPEKDKTPECNTSRLLNIDAKLTDKLESITQEEMFKKACSSVDFTKCNSYLGFKVKIQNSKTEQTTENDLKDRKYDCKSTFPCKASKQEDNCKTGLKTTKSQYDCIQLKTNCDTIGNSKSESFLNKELKEGSSTSLPQDCKELITKPTCINQVSLCNAKQKSKLDQCSKSKSNVKGGKNKKSLKKLSSKSSKKCTNKIAPGDKAANLKSKEKKSKHTGKKEYDSKKNSEKSSLCGNSPVSSEKKGSNENMMNDTDKVENCCKSSANKIDVGRVGQDKQVCCKKTEKEIDESCEKRTTPDDCHPTSDRETNECPTAKEKEKERSESNNNLGEQKCKDTTENNKKAKSKVCLKNIITGATQRKKANICNKVKSLQSIKSQSSSVKLNKTKIKNKFPEKSQKNDETSFKKPTRSKSAKVCSENKSNIDKSSKKSKSKHSICSKASKGNILDRSKHVTKSQKGESLTKLKKLVRRAQCGTKSLNEKEKFVTKALICSKSTTSVQSVQTEKNKKSSGLSKPKGGISKKPSTSNTTDSRSKKVKASKNETKTTKMCSFHTLQKRMTEMPNKTSKRIDAKSFSELKTNYSLGENDSAEPFISSKYYSQFNLQKSDENNTRVKATGVIEELHNTEPKTEGNTLKIPNWGENALMKPKKISPSFKIDKYFQLLLNSLTHETQGNKHDTTNTFKLDTNISKNDKLMTDSNGQTALITKSLNNVKEHSDIKLQLCDTKSKCQQKGVSLIYKENNCDEYHKIGNKNKTFNIQTEDARINIKEATNSNKITTKAIIGTDKLKGKPLNSNGNVSSLLKETCFMEGLHKGEKFKNQTHQATRDISNTDIKSVNQTTRARSAASNKTFKSAFSIPHKTRSPSKTKSFGSFNALKQHDVATRHEVRPLQTPNSETNKDFNIKTLNSKSDNHENTTLKMSHFPPNKMTCKSQLQPLKYENSTKISEIKVSPTKDKSSFDYGFVVPKKLQNLQINEPKHNMVNESNSKGQTNGNKDNSSNEILLCDFIEGSFDVNVENIEPKYLSKNPKFTTNLHPKNPNQSEVKEAEKEKKRKQFIAVGKNNVKYNKPNKKETNKAAKSTVKNKMLIFDEFEKHVSKLDTVVPSMKRIFKPVYLNSGISVEDENQELKKNILAVNTKVEDKKFESQVGKRSETESKRKKENCNNIKQTRNSVDQTVCDKAILNVNNTFITSNNTKKLQGIAINHFEKHEQKEETKNNINLKQGVPIKTPVNSKYSPKFKTKIQLISKRHRKFTNYNHKKTPSTAIKIERENCKNPEPTETIKTSSETKINHPSLSNKNVNSENQDSKTYSNITASLSSKQSKLLMQQHFFRKSKSEHSTENALNIPKTETSLVSSHINKTKDSLSPVQPERQLKLLSEQPFYNKQIPESNKSEPSTKNTLCNTKSESSLAKQLTENEFHSSKSENNLEKPYENDTRGISPRKQQISIRSQLQRKIPRRAVIQGDLKKTEQD